MICAWEPVVLWHSICHHWSNYSEYSWMGPMCACLEMSFCSSNNNNRSVISTLTVLSPLYSHRAQVNMSIHKAMIESANQSCVHAKHFIIVSSLLDSVWLLALLLVRLEWMTGAPGLLTSLCRRFMGHHRKLTIQDSCRIHKAAPLFRITRESMNFDWLSNFSSGPSEEVKRGSNKEESGWYWLIW